jgi:transmembrane sensor
MNTKYISEIIHRYFNQRHAAETESEIQKWLISKQHEEQKKEVLFDIWKNIKSNPNAEVYRSLDVVQQKLNMKRSRKMLWQNPFLKVAAVLLPFIFVASLYLFYNNYGTVEITTAQGEQKEITLPDSSVVWLNACSKITYSKKFRADKREITLLGEAFFSVKKDASRRFVVTTKDMTVTVFGTQFNVKCYPEDIIASTTLKSGKVEVALDSKDYILKPDQELVYNRQEKNSVIQDATESSMSWREGILNFSNMTLPEMVKSIERQYRINFKYNPMDYSNDNYSVKFSKKDSIEDIMQVLQDVVGGFSYSIKNNIITLKKQSK